MPPGEFFPAGTWDRMAAYLRSIPALVASVAPQPPQSLLIVSAHWDEPVPTTYAPPVPPTLLFDYHGFPDYTYKLAYPAPADTALAARVRSLLEDAGIASADNQTRGFDHGVFIPMMLAFPDARLPIAQLSLRSGFDAAAHLAVGRALAPLREQGVLLIASGLSYHNLRAIASPSHNAAAAEFDAWLAGVVTDPDPMVRNRALIEWDKAPGARAAHPTPEHLVPLLVAAGAAADAPGTRDYSDQILGKAVSAFRFG